MAEGAVALVGTIEVYNVGEDFTLYINRLNHLLSLNKIKDNADKTSFLISLGGAELYKTMCSLLTPKKETDFTYEEIVEKLTKHFKPNKNIIVECFKFFKRDQKSSETIADYIVELKQLAQECDFGLFLDKALLIKFVCGLLSESIQNRILNESGLKYFDKACQIALSMEMSNNNIELMRSNGSVNRLNYGKQRRTKRQEENNFDARVNEKRRGYNKAEVRCFYCKKRGHIERNCWIKRNDEEGEKRKSNMQNKRKNKYVKHLDCSSDELSSVSSQSEYLNNLYSCNYTQSLFISVKIEDVNIEMEIDTGACVSICHISYYNDYFQGMKLEKQNLKKFENLKVVTGEAVDVVGYIIAKVEFNGRVYNLKLVFLKCENKFKPLVGRNWLDELFPNWRNTFCSINSIQKFSVDGCCFEKFNTLFSKLNTSTINHYEAEIVLKEESYPVFAKAYSVPFGLRDKVEKEIDKMCKEGVLVPVNRSKWASPIVIVNKGDGSIRICVDCRRTVNRFVENEHYVIPRVDDILANLSGWKYFCKLDLTGAYLQVKLSERSRELLTINTHKGLYQYTRLVYGLKTAPQIFSKIVCEILKGLEKVQVYFDDILIGGCNMNDCRKNLTAVLDKLLEFNVKINFDKCRFFETEINYLGYTINSNGITPSKSKIQALVEAPAPKDKSQLRSFLGMINYYNHCIPNLSAELHILHDLTKNNVKWVWTENHQSVFERSKELISKIGLLTHYDSTKPIVISCDASPYGVGGVLSHIIDGKDHPVMFVSSTLKPAERNYSQLHREALAIVYSVRKFHKYIYGLQFTIESDHQPLREIFSVNKELPSVASSRLHRWAIFLSSYNYNIKYRKGSRMLHADALSRLPTQHETGEDSDSINIFQVLHEFPINIENVTSEMSQDKELKQVYKYIRYGWPEEIPNNLEKYYNKRVSLATEEGCLFYGERIVIPSTLRSKVLELLHSGHIGIVRMKSLARTYVWWPGLDRDIEMFVKMCQVCGVSQNTPKPILTSWPTPKNPFERIHIDFCKIENITILVIVDTFSKWIDVKIMKSTTAQIVNEALRSFFAIFGLPKEVVSDNGPPFSSKEFIEFCTNSGIKVLKSPPYHPASNGSAERAVQTVKASLKKYLLDPKSKQKSWDFKINNFLLKYRTTPTAVTGMSPANLIFSFRPKTLLDMVNPRVSTTKQNKVDPERNVRKGELYEDKKLNIIEYKPNDVVYYRNVLNNYCKWVKATIVSKLSNVRYCICINGSQRVAHINQLRKFYGKIIKYNHVRTYRIERKKRRRSCSSEQEIRRSERIKRQKENKDEC